MYKLVLSDLDETLIVDNHIPEKNLEAIKQVREKGVKFVLATGRAPTMITHLTKEIGTYNQENEFSICFNGGLIVENIAEGNSFKKLYFKGLETPLAQKIFEEGKKRQLCMLVFTIDCCHIFNPDQWEVDRKISQKTPIKIYDQCDFDFIKDEAIAKVLLVKRDMDYLKQFKEELIEKVGNKVEISFSSNRYMECNGAGINKGHGLRYLAQYLNIDIEDTIAIGDNYNDVSMLKAAGVGACIAGANDEIKALSNYVCKHDFDEGAVSEVLSYHILDKESL